MRASLFYSAATVTLCCMGCKDQPTPAQPMFHVPIVGLALPQLSGWKTDPNVRIDDPAKGGVIFRLVRSDAVLGSPRLMVWLQPLQAHRTLLEEFLTENLRAMAARESAGEIRIIQVDQRPVHIGPRRGFRVRHEYTVGKGNHQMAVTQVSTLLVLGGRGVTITAAGRTELFHPMANSIEMMIDGINTPVPQGTNVPTQPIGKPSAAPAKSNAAQQRSLVEPIDLGQLGGNR